LAFLVDSNISPVTALLKTGFNKHIKREYVRILKREMPRSRELDILNRGFVVRQGNEIYALPAGQVGRKVGSADKGRFITAAWTPIARAVEQEPVVVDANAPRGILRVGSVDRDSIREKTTFKWFLRDKRGRFRGRGETEPFGGIWITVLEQGGSVRVPNFGRLVRNPRVIRTTQFTGDSGGQTVRRRGNEWQWLVEPRNKRKRLWPEDKIWVWKMRKTVQPIGMFKRALFTKTRPMMTEFKPKFVRMVANVSGFQTPRR
jgi:hypothetical protein